MASGTDNWIADTVGDFIHSPIWSAPIRTFINANCLIFEYDDDDENDTDERSEKLAILEEQKNIFRKYQRLADALVTSLGKDLGLDENEVTKACQIPVPFDDAVLSDERYEQLYSARDFELFQNMMRKRNLILQLQALISLQLQWGLIRPGDTRDDLIVSLLSQATGSSSRRGSTTLSQEPAHVPVIKQQARREEQIPKHNDNDDDEDVVTAQKDSPPPVRKTKPKVEPKQAPKEERRLPSLRHKGAPDLDAQWHRDLRRGDSKSDDDENSAENDQSQDESTLQTISAIPEKLLRQKLRDLKERTSAAVDDETASAIRERQKFLEAQRKKIIEDQRAKQAQELEQQAPHARPQSARRAQQFMKAENEKKQAEEQQQPIPNDEIKKRQTLMAKLKREVVEKK